MPIEAELQASTPPIVLERVALNQLALKQYAQQLEMRAGCKTP